jgi:hypothetical protein
MQRQFVTLGDRLRCIGATCIYIIANFAMAPQTVGLPFRFVLNYVAG